MLRKEIEKDVNEIVKMKKTDQQKQKKEIKKKMQDKVDLTGKSIRKEVGDVEKILR
jgi:gamma-glutamyl phosphate reductase